MEIKDALLELRKSEKREFDQTVDLLINLKDIDLRKDSINVIVTLPHPLKAKKVCAFLEKKSEIVRTITPLDFGKFKEKKDLKKLVKDYDFFISAAKLMPSVATHFGKALGPTGKMPSPQLGVLMQSDDASIQATIDKINKSVKIKAKEPSIKIAIGKQSMKDEDIIANVQAVYQAVVQALPIKKDNVRNVMLKLTMSKPVKVEMK